MRRLRSKVAKRGISVFMLMTFVSSIFSPHHGYALTTGPHQPEYISYESPGATDMVNLLTGDFSYSLPLLEVPGPEGGFSLPLTYSAGIGLEQEASWVGLGWTLNPGAITRNINEFPDDASGESHSISVKDPGIRGWSSSLMGLGQAGWNTEQGHYGAISFLTWNESGVKVDPVALTLAAISTISGVGAVATFGQTAGAAGVVAKSISLGVEVVSAGMNVARSVKAARAPNAPSAGHWEYSRRVKQRLFHKNYWIWLDQTRVEDMLGVLYLDQADLESYSAPVGHLTPQIEINEVSSPLLKFPLSGYKGSASDISYDMSGGTDYEDLSGPALLAFDDFSVKAPGIGGNIRPSRLDIGSVSMPRKMTAKHERLVPISYQSYKVPFVYEGTTSGSYFHHVGSDSDDVDQPSFHFGITKEVGNPIPSQNTSVTYHFDDIIFDQQRMSPGVSETSKIPQANHIEYLTNEEIGETEGAFSNGFMDYFDDSDRQTFREQFDFGPLRTFYGIIDSNTFGLDGEVTLEPDGYFSPGQFVGISVIAYDTEMDWIDGINGVEYHYEDIEVLNVGTHSIGLDESSFTTDLTGKYCRVAVHTQFAPKMPKSIGGFSITGVDGLTYHFALPIYDYDNETLIVAKDNDQKSTRLARKEPFASTWLLTGVTGPDFVDRGGGTGGEEANGTIDDRDWGFWVRLNYGKASDNYQWATPFEGTRSDPANTSKISSSGYKQLYYLNSIETRSHAAIFLKSERKDSRSKNDVSSLRLDDIYLLSKADYKKLTSSDPGGFSLPAISGDIENLWMVDDFFQSPENPLAPGEYIVRQAAKHIDFGYSYALCQETPNSIASSKGKLTLERLGLVGRAGKRIHPDYLFEYGFNPDYSANSWDAFGLYSPVASVEARTATEEGNAWSLRRITTPLGGSIEVEYERDTYSSVSEFPVELSYMFSGLAGVDYPDPYPSSQITELKVTGLTDDLAVGDEVTVEMDVDYVCSSTGHPVYEFHSDVHSVTDISANLVTIYPPILPFDGCTGNVTDLAISGLITKSPVNKIGGNLRVASIALKDENIEKSKVRYLYDDVNGVSSGVISKEPEFKNGIARGKFIDSKPGYPFTPVVYGKVTVLSGGFLSESDYTTKQVYEFVTPHTSMVSHQKVEVENVDIRTYLLFKDRLLLAKNEIENRTSEIGNVKSVRTYDGQDHLVAETTYEYTDDLNHPDSENDLYQGVYSEGTIMFDAVRTDNILTSKITRTTVLTYPSTLKKVTSVRDGFTSSEETTAWDYYSGAAIEKSMSSPLGVITKSVVIPAYTKYPAMGSKAHDIGNKNMMIQIAGDKSYRMNNENSVIGLIGASATTWDDDLNGVWRKKSYHEWVGGYGDLKNDGTRIFDIGDEFEFATPSENDGWEQLGETTLYDRFSLPAESKDRNGIYNSVVTGYGDQLKIAEAANAKANEIAFSGAEDLEGLHFSGGIALGDGTVKYLDRVPIATSVHTGNAAVSVTSGHSFTYEASNLAANRTYRASVWTNSSNGRIYYMIDGGPGDFTSAVPTVSVDGWYRVDLEIPAQPNEFSLEVGVKSVGGEVYFDDFRFQPTEAVMTCYVYPPSDIIYSSPSQHTFVYHLDNQNLYTKYEYDQRGRVIKVYRESLHYGVKLMSESKQNFRRPMME